MESSQPSIDEERVSINLVISAIANKYLLQLAAEQFNGNKSDVVREAIRRMIEDELGGRSNGNHSPNQDSHQP